MDIGNWVLEKQIGEGAFGRTFRFKHRLLKGVRACVKQEKTLQQPFMDLFREEAAVIARLSHPSLPSFIDYLELPAPIGQVLVISYMDGQPLDKVVHQKVTAAGSLVASKPIDDEHVCWIIDRILGALSYLHGRWNIIHCDLKPANIILDIAQHNAAVVDLGMAAIKPDEWSKAKGGTPGYLPPEFGTGLPPIPASDIYSVGKIACFISGGDPLKGEFPSDMHPKLLAFFEPWIRHDPRQRPQNVDALRHELSTLRREVFGRSTCDEEFKFRHRAGKGGKS